MWFKLFRIKKKFSFWLVLWASIFLIPKPYKDWIKKEKQSHRPVWTSAKSEIRSLANWVWEKYQKNTPYRVYFNTPNIIPNHKIYHYK